MKNFKKIILSLAVIALVLSCFQVPLGKSRTKVYYSGDAINYQGKIVVASTDSDSLELFQLSGKTLKSVAKFKPVDARFGTDSVFYTVILREEIGRLYAYASTGKEIFKYNVSDPKNIILADKIKDNSGDWFGGLEISNGSLITKGTKGVKVWNRDTQVVDSFNVFNASNPYSITVGNGYDYIFNVVGNQVEIFGRQDREVIKRVTLNNENKGNVKIYNDPAEGMFYIPDGKQLKKYNYRGDIHKSISHDSSFGYDIAPSIDGKYIYFTNGRSIKKLDKIDLKLIDEYQNRTDLGYWAMGLKVVRDSEGEKVVIFNNASITIFDSNLEIIARVKATEQAESESVKPTEKLFLQLNKKSAKPFEEVVVSGGGYAANEAITITLGDQKIIAYVGEDGRFAKNFTVGISPAGRKDIKVVGQKSGQSYSISFEIEEVK